MSWAEAVGHTFDFIKRRKMSYQLACNQPATQEMLIDLAKFCHANETCVMVDATGRVDEPLTRMREGRREVWLRIQQHLNLNSSQLFTLYTGKQLNPGEIDG